MSLGNFSPLPPEIREQIWLHFVPTGQDTLARCKKTDLSILRTSRALYTEISNTIYQHSSIEFDIFPFYKNGSKWSTLHFSHRHYLQNEDDDDPDDHRARWYLSNIENARLRGFGCLPLQKMEEVVVNLMAPIPGDMGRLYCLRERVIEHIRLFEGASRIRKLVIRLQKRDGIDWFDMDKKKKETQRETDLYSHDVVFMLFCSLRNLESISVEPHSKKLQDTMDWRVINWGIKAVEEKRLDDINCKIAEHYFRLHQEIWENGDYTLRGVTQNIRRDFIQHWFEEGISGHSEFEKKMMHIATEYPEIFHKYDPEMSLLKNMHFALVCLYHHARVTFHRKSIVKTERWDSEKIRWTFFSGLPAAKSARYRRDIQPLLDMRVYAEYIQKGGIFCTMHRFLSDWEAGIKRPLTSNNDESTADSSYTDDTPEPHIADIGRYTPAVDDDTLRTPEAHQ